MTVALMYPVDAPITGPYLSTAAPDWSAARPHHGVDFGCGMGTPVKLWHQRAKVHGIYGQGKPFGDGSFGRCIVFDIEGTPWYTLYAHLSAVNVAPGEYLNPGQVVGLSGASGARNGVYDENRYAPHLHVQMSRNSSFLRDKDAGATLGDLTTDPFFDLPGAAAGITLEDLISSVNNLNTAVLQLQAAYEKHNHGGPQ